MNRLFKTSILTAAVAATSLAAMPANAGDRHQRRDRPPVVYHHNNGGDAVAAGIIGLAAGAIVAGILANPQPAEPGYYEPYRHPRPDRDYFPEPPRRMVYRDEARAAEPWSREWYRYCQWRYRSFDPDSGTYMTREGDRRFCVAQ